MRSYILWDPFLDYGLLAKLKVFIYEGKVFFSILFTKQLLHCDQDLSFFSHFFLFGIYFCLLFFLFHLLLFLVMMLVMGRFLELFFFWVMVVRLWVFLWVVVSGVMLFPLLSFFVESSTVSSFEILEFSHVKLNNFVFIELLQNLLDIHVRIFFNIGSNLFNRFLQKFS